MADNDPEDEDGHNNNNNESESGIISVHFARKLCHIACNCENIATSLVLDLDLLTSSQAAELAGDALKRNKSIKYLKVHVHETIHFSIESLKGLFDFVSKNPSLTTLNIIAEEDVERNACDIGQKLLQAAEHNKTIQRIRIEGNFLAHEPAQFKVPEHIREFATFDISDGLAPAWPSHHNMEILRLRQNNPIPGTPFFPHTFEKLLQTTESNKIQQLHIEGWNAAVPSFLASKNSSLSRLVMGELDFRHSEALGCSIIDGLLWGLMQSHTTTKISFEECKFDRHAIVKLVNAITSNWLRIQHLDFIDGMENAEGEHIQSLLECPSLEALGLLIDEIDTHTQFIESGIQKCSLSSLKITTGEDIFCILGSALGSAMSTRNLTALELCWCQFEEADLDCLIGLITYPACQLRMLTWANCRDGTEVAVEAGIFAALKENTNGLDSLRLLSPFSQPNTHVFDSMIECLADITTLKDLEIRLSNNESPPRLHENLADAFASNWSLEQLLLAGGRYDNDRELLPFPVTTASFERLVEGVMQRNTRRKLLFSSDLAQKTTWECLEILESMWELPDCLSLAFWLFNELPDRFFTTSSSSVVKSAGMKRRRTTDGQIMENPKRLQTATAKSTRKHRFNL